MRQFPVAAFAFRPPAWPTHPHVYPVTEQKNELDAFLNARSYFVFGQQLPLRLQVALTCVAQLLNLGMQLLHIFLAGKTRFLQLGLVGCALRLQCRFVLAVSLFQLSAVRSCLCGHC
jgi:hypothetical protein